MRRRRGAPRPQAPLDALIAPYKQKLYEDRVAMLPADVQAIIRKPEKERTVAEQKIADDYFPVLRIDADKIQEIMPPDVLKKYKELQAQVNQAGGGGGRRGGGAPAGLLDRGVGSRREAGEELHPDQRRPRAAREGQAGGARMAVRARQDRFPRRPHRDLLRLADRAGESDVRARRREPPLAVALWRGPAKELQRFRQARRIAQPIRSCSIGWPPNLWRAISA